MNVIFEQSFNYACINKFKLYNSIYDEEKMKIKYERYDFIDAELEPQFQPKPSMLNTRLSNVTSDYFKKFKKEKYFDKELKYNSLKYPLIVTTKDRHIKRCYGSFDTTIFVYTYYRRISIDNDVLNISLFKYKKVRHAGTFYFKKITVKYSINFNYKTGNFITRKEGNIFRTNNFEMLSQALRIILGADGQNDYIFPIRKLINRTNEVESEYYKNFDRVDFIYELLKVLKNPMLKEDIRTNQKDSFESLINVILKGFMQNFIEYKKIKTPNTFTNLLYHYYPGEKALKKNDRKLISSILSYFGFKSKSTIKYLHQYSINGIGNFIIFCSLFGEDYYKYISKIEHEVLKIDSKEGFVTHSEKFISKFRLINSIKMIKDWKLDLTYEEKNNLLHLINNGNVSIDSILDHFRMYAAIKILKIPIKFKSNNSEKFRAEHVEYTTINQLINKGWVRKYKYDEYTTHIIEKPIILADKFNDTRKFCPIILKDQNQYNEESSSMHHCVNSYVEKTGSIIISIRNVDGNNEIINRTTCEYDIKTGKLLQARYLQNAEPPHYFIDVIDILNKRVKKLAIEDKLKWISTEKINIIINGVEVNKNHVEINFIDNQLVFGEEIIFP